MSRIFPGRIIFLNLIRVKAFNDNSLSNTFAMVSVTMFSWAIAGNMGSFGKCPLNQGELLSVLIFAIIALLLSIPAEKYEYHICNLEFNRLILMVVLSTGLIVLTTFISIVCRWIFPKKNPQCLYQEKRKNSNVLALF